LTLAGESRESTVVATGMGGTKMIGGQWAHVGGACGHSPQPVLVTEVQR
jgi:hypothetical protein